jgi:hypothetical protein
MPSRLSRPAAADASRLDNRAILCKIRVTFSLRTNRSLTKPLGSSQSGCVPPKTRIEKRMSILSTRKRRLTALVAAAAIVALGGGLAYAYWTGTGTGVGSATTGSSTNFTVTSVAPTGAALTPGGPAQTVGFTVTNTGTGSQNLASVVATVANANGSAWVAVPGCSAADYAVGTPAVTYGQIAGSGSVNGTVTVTMNNLGTNQDACKGVTAPLYFVAS